MTEKNRHLPQQLSVENLSQAIFIVNRHAKAAPNPKYLYLLKQESLKKLILEGKAIKKGLHFSQNPRFSQQQSDVLVICGDYSFHMPPVKEDFKTLPHLGKLDQFVRNPKTRMPLNDAKRLLEQYTGLKEKTPPQNRNQRQQPVFKRLGDSYF